MASMLTVGLEPIGWARAAIYSRGAISYGAFGVKFVITACTNRDNADSREGNLAARLRSEVCLKRSLREGIGLPADGRP